MAASDQGSASDELLGNTTRVEQVQPLALSLQRSVTAAGSGYRDACNTYMLEPGYSVDHLFHNGNLLPFHCTNGSAARHANVVNVNKHTAV